MRTRLLLPVIMLLALAMLALAGCATQGDEAKLGLTPGSAEKATDGTTASGGGAGSSGAKSTATATEEPSSGGTNQQSSSGSGGTTKPTKQLTTKQGMLVKILWWNDTKAKSPNGMEIMYGGKSFKPDTSRKDQIGTIGPVPYDTTSQLIIYPDGRNGKRIVATFKVDKAMKANSDIDGIHVAVDDTGLRIIGSAVTNFEQDYDRF